MKTEPGSSLLTGNIFLENLGAWGDKIITIEKNPKNLQLENSIKQIQIYHVENYADHLNTHTEHTSCCTIEFAIEKVALSKRKLYVHSKYEIERCSIKITALFL